MTTIRPPDDRRGLAFSMALALHAAVFLSAPYLNRAPAPQPLRVEIDLTQTIAEPTPPTPPPPPPQPQPVQPRPQPQPPTPKSAPQHQQAQPILTARDDTPSAPQDPVAPPNPPMPPAGPVAPSAPVSTPSEAVPGTASSNVSAGASSAYSDEADRDEAWNGYGQILFEQVSKNKTYPQIAIRRHWQGTARVSARFEAGRLVELALIEPGSGHQALDDAALEMLRKAVNALPVKGSLARKSFTVIVPVDFKIEG